MSRLIREEDVIREIDKWLDNVGTAYVGKGLSYYGELLGCISDAPTVDVPDTNVGKWIPCSEGLPEPRRSVLIFTNSSCGQWTGEGCYWETTEHHVVWKGYRWNATYWDDEVVAWMPLPDPYREKVQG